MKTIRLSEDECVFVDDRDFESVSKLKWFSVRGGYTRYAAASIQVDGKKTTVLMHRMVMNCTPDEEVDHKNRNGLDNTRGNLRIATRSENMRNSRRRKDNKSGFKGVSFHRDRRKWTAHIMLNKKSMYLGLFTTPEEAHAAYCAAATSFHGEFACTK